MSEQTGTEWIELLASAEFWRFEAAVAMVFAIAFGVAGSFGTLRRAFPDGAAEIAPR